MLTKKTAHIPGLGFFAGYVNDLHPNLFLRRGLLGYSWAVVWIGQFNTVAHSTQSAQDSLSKRPLKRPPKRLLKQRSKPVSHKKVWALHTLLTAVIGYCSMRLTKTITCDGTHFSVERYTSVATPGLVIDHWNSLWYLKHASSGRYLAASVDKGEAFRILEHLSRWAYIDWTDTWESLEQILFKIIDRCCIVAKRGRLKQLSFDFSG